MTDTSNSWAGEDHVPVPVNIFIEGQGFEPIKGWMGVEDHNGRVLLTNDPQDALIATVSGVPFPVYRKVKSDG